MLVELKFPRKFIHLMMVCVSIILPNTLMINGNLHGFVFAFKRGLGQGHSISPLLFVICMEYLLRIMRKVYEHNKFKFHPVEI